MVAVIFFSFATKAIDQKQSIKQTKKTGKRYFFYKMRADEKCLANSLSKVFSYFSVEELQIIRRRKYRHRRAVSELTSKEDERAKIMVNSCIWNLDRRGMSVLVNRNSCAVWAREVKGKVCKH